MIELGWMLTKWVTVPLLIIGAIFYFVARKYEKNDNG